jgi:hypothetical protein
MAVCLGALSCQTMGGTEDSRSFRPTDATTDPMIDAMADTDGAEITTDASDAGIVADGGGTLVLVEAGSISPGNVSVAVDETSLFWTDWAGDRVMRTPLAGGPAEVVASSGTPGPWGIVVDATYAYWFSGRGQRVLRCPKGATGCTPTVISAPATPSQIAIDGNDVYWWASGDVVACSIDGCRDQPTVLATGVTTSGFVAVATDGTSVYWAAGNDVGKCPVGGCGDASTILATGLVMSAPSIALDHQNVYWTEDNGRSPMGGAVFRCAIGGCDGGPDLLAGDAGDPEQLVTDGTRVFFIQDPNPPFLTGSRNPTAVVTCPIDGCGSAPTVLYADYAVWDLAINQTRVIVVSTGGIVSLPKP